jgi:hypothetical protein
MEGNLNFSLNEYPLDLHRDRQYPPLKEANCPSSGQNHMTAVIKE